ncbi:MAG: class II aldolase/adducin family protein [Clostridiales bacterium]|nr:class II aldolase/adducin family protein [Clostridiales bacterium]
MRYGFSKREDEGHLTEFLDGLDRILQAHGHQPTEVSDPDIGLVLHPIDPEGPRPFRRQGRGTYVVSIVAKGPWPSGDEPYEAILARYYPAMIRSLANLLVVPLPPSPESSRRQAFIVTLERGAYPVRGETEEEFYQGMYEALAPLAQSCLVIDNIFEPDLPEELWNGDEHTRSMAWAGARLDELNLLPAPFPIREILDERDYRHLKKLYQIGGLSYGNLSVRQEGNRFWMSGSGVDKSRLSVVGRDFLLVKGYDPERNAMILSVPPHIEPNRVSVDAIEHWMIYTEHPQVGAILHIHAWIDGIRSTQINYPCGSLELAQAVAEAVRQEPDPGRAIIGLRNHGMTITGPSLEEIFSRIEGKVRTQVPMM